MVIWGRCWWIAPDVQKKSRSAGGATGQIKTKVSRIYPAGTLNVCAKYNGNPSKSFCDILVWMANQQTDTIIPRAMLFSWLKIKSAAAAHMLYVFSNGLVVWFVFDLQKAFKDLYLNTRLHLQFCMPLMHRPTVALQLQSKVWEIENCHPFRGDSTLDADVIKVRDIRALALAIPALGSNYQ